MQPSSGTSPAQTRFLRLGVPKQIAVVSKAYTRGGALITSVQFPEHEARALGAWYLDAANAIRKDADQCPT